MVDHDPAPPAQLPTIRLTESEPEFVLWEDRTRSLMLRRRTGKSQPAADAPPTVPGIILPSLALQFVLDDATYAKVIGPLTAALYEEFGPQADIRPRCRENVRKIGIWLQPTNPQVNQGRENGLESLELEIPAGSQIRAFVKAGYVRSEAEDIFDTTPKRLNTDGVPDSGGAIHLTRLKVAFAAPNIVRTIVSGWIDILPDIDFTFTLTDRLATSSLPPGLGARTTEHFEADTGLLIALGGFAGALAAAVVSAFVPGLGIGIAGAVGAGYGPGLAAILELYPITPGLGGGGAGARAMRKLPFEVMVGGGQKVVLDYRRVFVNLAGIHAAAAFGLAQRTPFARLSGPDRALVRGEEKTVTVAVRVVTDDLRPPLRVKWLAGSLVSQEIQKNIVTARIRLGVTPASPVKAVKVRITDADGLQAEAAIQVQLHILSEDGPVVCIKRPWLPECQI
ncbi:MAG: hypothetical protein QOD42_3446 [Sphingomonadales bacterium]|jgi:hypothetical protein|nr:hypothetical protein [Sphingomonadales bacterium]